MSIALYSVQMLENTDQHDSEYGHISEMVIMVAVLFSMFRRHLVLQITDELLQELSK